METAFVGKLHGLSRLGTRLNSNATFVAWALPALINREMLLLLGEHRSSWVYELQLSSDVLGDSISKNNQSWSDTVMLSGFFIKFLLVPLSTK